MGKRTEFLYLSEPDTVKAGVLDAARCVDVCEEVFGLLSDGDYLMGGPNHNSHGMGIIFPKESPFPNMPLAGPDRRFFAMPAYVGGRFDICGNKWYGSNAANTKKGLPRSVLTLNLNDKDTGEPVSFLSANLISAARTGAVPGVAARYLARKDAKTCSVVGCGPINRACFGALATQLSGLATVLCHDLFADKAEAFAAWARETYGLEAEAVSLEEAMRRGGVVTVAASRLAPLKLRSEWLPQGSTVLLSGPAKADDNFWTDCRLVYDSVSLHEAYVEEAIASGDKQAYYDSVIGGPIYRLIDSGKLPPLAQSVSLGDIVRGKAPGRETPREKAVFVACGMAVFDVAWGYDLYQNALKQDIGQKLLLWEQAMQA